MNDDDDLKVYVASLLLQFYGNLLKVSRVKNMTMNLPMLRKFVKENEDIREQYDEMLQEEIEGMGLKGNLQLQSLRIAQLEELESGSPKNNTTHADEIKKIIERGESDRKEGDAVTTKTIGYSEERIVEFIENPLDFDIDTLSKADCDEIRVRLLGNFEMFSLWAFQIQMGFKFMMMDYHKLMFEFCQKIVDGEFGMARAIINIPPRGGKTQIISILLPLYSFCHNAGSHNMLLSFNESVVLESSGYIRTIMLDERFQKVFPKVKIDPSKRSLDKWGTTSAGVLHAITGSGKVTGRGAGSISEVFSGIQCIDDILKPLDAYSATEREKVNDNYTNTLLSRLACDGFEDNGKQYLQTPQVIIMQRLHDQDLCGHLFRGGGGSNFVWLNIPGVIHEDTGSAEWYDRLIKKHAYTHAIPYTYDLGRKGKSSFWEARKSLESLEGLEQADPYNFSSQYLGDPTAKGMGVVDDDWWQEYEPKEFDLSKIKRTFMVADTASTAQTYSDYSVIGFFGLSEDNNLYLLDAEVGKWETPKLMEVMGNIWAKHNKLNMTYPRLLPRTMYVENKSSGHYIMQQIAKTGSIKMTPVPRDKTAGNDKLTRFLNTVPYFAQGRLYFPSGHKHIDHIRREILGFTSLGSGTGHDDVVDVISDACAVAFSQPTANYGSWI